MHFVISFMLNSLFLLIWPKNNHRTCKVWTLISKVLPPYASFLPFFCVVIEPGPTSQYDSISTKVSSHIVAPNSGEWHRRKKTTENFRMTEKQRDKKETLTSVPLDSLNTHLIKKQQQRTRNTVRSVFLEFDTFLVDGNIPQRQVVECSDILLISHLDHHFYYTDFQLPPMKLKPEIFFLGRKKHVRWWKVKDSIQHTHRGYSFPSKTFLLVWLRLLLILSPSILNSFCFFFSFFQFC